MTVKVNACGLVKKATSSLCYFGIGGFCGTQLAICHAVFRKNPVLRILYEAATVAVGAMIVAKATDTIDEFSDDVATALFPEGNPEDDLVSMEEGS